MVARLLCIVLLWTIMGVSIAFELKDRYLCGVCLDLAEAYATDHPHGNACSRFGACHIWPNASTLKAGQGSCSTVCGKTGEGETSLPDLFRRRRTARRRIMTEEFGLRVAKGVEQCVLKM